MYAEIRAPPVGFELATNGIQFYVIANLDRDVMPDIASEGRRKMFA